MAVIKHILIGGFILFILGCNSKPSQIKTDPRLLIESYDINCSTAIRYNKVIGFQVIIESKTDCLLNADQLRDLQNEFRVFNGKESNQLYDYFGCFDNELLSSLRNKESYNVWIKIEQPESKNTISRVFAIRENVVSQYFELTTSGAGSY